MQVRFELTGVMPLLMHQDDVEAADLLQKWRKDPANKNLSTPGDDRSPAWTWQTYLYHDGTHVVLPAANIAVALRQAGTQMILKRQKTFKELTQSGMLITTEFCEFRCHGNQIALADLAAVRDLPFTEQADRCRELGFRLFAKRARIGTSKNIRVRPRFDNWSVSGVIDVFALELTLPVLQQLFEIAGRVGLCDWRPGCKTPGPFGMFQAELAKV